MSNVRKYFYLFFLFLNMLGLAMDEPHTIPPHIKRAIVRASSADKGALIFNESIEQNTITPTVANTRWCIYTLTDKNNHAPSTFFAIASKLNPSLASAWLAQYINDAQRFETARSTLQGTIETNNPQLAAFLLSSKSMKLSNSCSSGNLICRFAYYSVVHNRNEILMRLLEAGSDITHLESSNSWAPIHLAAWQGNHEAVQLLLNCGQKPDFFCGQGKSALFHVCNNHRLTGANLETAFLLLDHGANTNIITAEDPNRNRIESNLKFILEKYSRKKRIF